MKGLKPSLAKIRKNFKNFQLIKVGYRTQIDNHPS